MTKFIIILILITILIVFVNIQKREVVYIESDLDRKKYLVRDLEDKQRAANLLAKIKKNITKLVGHLEKGMNGEYKEYRPYINQLRRRIKRVIINESSEDSKYTSYSVNKGEQIVFCLRSKKEKNKMHDINLLMYVVLHELSHVASPEYGHTPLFKKIFAFMTNIAIEIGMYRKIEFNSDPKEYCGLVITDSII